MKNIHIIPTDKPSRLTIIENKLLLSHAVNWESKPVDWEQGDGVNQNIYITSDEEIKEGDWVLGDFPDNPIGKVISKYGQEFTAQSLNGDKYGLAEYDSKKIILTTDQELIKDGVQAIPDEFLKWFVKNPSCEFVEIRYTVDFNSKAVIIIPKEEPKQTVQEYEQQGLEKYSHELKSKQDYKKMSKKFTETLTSIPDDVLIKYTQQETLEEAAKDYIENTMRFSFNSMETKTQANRMLKCVEFGAKWQQEQYKNKYSEEDLRNAYRWGTTVNHGTKEHFNEWFEQFKKK